MSQRERLRRMQWMYFVTCSEISDTKIMRAYYWMRKKGVEMKLKK